jgi:hypothetical protein
MPAYIYNSSLENSIFGASCQATGQKKDRHKAVLYFVSMMSQFCEKVSDKLRFTEAISGSVQTQILFSALLSTTTCPEFVPDLTITQQSQSLTESY